MKLTPEEYRRRVEGCWIGKNIGGTLGMPMEWNRATNDVSYYTHDKGQPARRPGAAVFRHLQERLQAQLRLVYPQRDLGLPVPGLPGACCEVRI